MIYLCEYLPGSRPAGVPGEQSAPVTAARQSGSGSPGEIRGVRILECRGLDNLAVLPEQINGFPVVELAPYLFSEHGNDRGAGQPSGAFWWPADREEQMRMPQVGDELPALRGGRLEELHLPASLERVGAYALYNCGNLQKLEFYSTVADWGAGVFTGCYGVKQLTVHVDESRKSCVREVLAELRQTLELVYLPEDAPRAEPIFAASSAPRPEPLSAPQTVDAAGPHAAPRPTALSARPSAAPSAPRSEPLSAPRTVDAAALRPAARLILPEFFEEAVENTPARILVTETHGCGQKYRNAFVRTQFQFKEYDSLFPHVQVQEPEELVSRLALDRLMYPYQLEPRYAQRYREYLEEHAPAAAGQAIAGGDMAALEWLFGHISYDAGKLEQLLELAGQRKNGAAVSFLMDRKRAAGAVRRKRFSL